MELSTLIAGKLKSEGPVSFEQFMEMLLYFPDMGYYTSDAEKFGRQGDYYTTPFLTPLFGKLLGKQLEEMWNNMDRKEFTLVEFGAGSGMLCNDILTYIQKNPEFYEKVNYVIIEKSHHLRRQEKKLLTDKVTWVDDIRELSGIRGCILSNEVIDNFPVHRVVMQKQLMEVFVSYKDGFVETLRPASPELVGYLREFNINLPEGYFTEINLAAREWMNQVADALLEGYVLTIDYGFDAATLYNKRRCNGTLMCYRNHDTNKQLYMSIGTQDVTAHVNFTALCRWGFMNGLECCGLTTQADFMMALGCNDFEFLPSDSEDLIQRVLNEARLRHLLLVEMGNKYKVLVQKKGNVTRQLSGLVH